MAHHTKLHNIVRVKIIFRERVQFQYSTVTVTKIEGGGLEHGELQ
jgi:hypothetical protein